MLREFSRRDTVAKINFITPDGDEVLVEASDGTLMEAATQRGVEGIDGDCGGVASCATCHVHIVNEWAERVGPATEIERDMLEFENNMTEFSRLSCQIDVTEELDGLVVRVVGR